MIGLDTNALLRVFVDDQPAQAAAIRNFVAKVSPAEFVVSDIVLAELVWVLGRRLRTRKARIVEILRLLSDRTEFVLENRSDVRAAIRLFASTRADFADCLIAVRNRRLGAAETVSFDEEAIEAGLFSPVPT
jgi:predicted nucleic-acid-binding protein